MLAALASCRESAPGEVFPEHLDSPEVKVSAVGPFSFTISWERVEFAESYRYSIDEQSVETTERRVVIDDLVRDREYTVSVVAMARGIESEPTVAIVRTGTPDKLHAPELQLGSSYASRTSVSWTDVPGASSYRYSLGSISGTTQDPRLVFTTLSKSASYTLSVTAVPDNGSDYLESDPAVLEFTTDSEDLPGIIMVPQECLPDAITVEIYAKPDETYYYEAVPAYQFAKMDQDALLEAARNVLVEYAADKGISLALALGSVLKAGSSTVKFTGLVPEMSYAFLAFGMNLKGEITTGLYSTIAKTRATGECEGPNFGGSDWFSQRFYISNSNTLYGLDMSNSVNTVYHGNNVVKVNFRILTTQQYKTAFPTDNESDIRKFLTTPGYFTTLGETLLSVLDTEGGANIVTQVSPGTSYTLMTLAQSALADETVCVNSAATLSSSQEKTWFLVGGQKNESYGPTHSTFVAVFKGLDIVSAKYMIKTAEVMSRYSVKDYGRLVETNGHDFTQEQVEHISGGGLGLICKDMDPDTEYMIVATATNSFGDTVTHYGTVKTDPAPETKSVRSGVPSFEAFPLSAGFSVPGYELTSMYAVPEEDAWSQIHNKRIGE